MNNSADGKMIDETPPSKSQMVPIVGDDNSDRMMGTIVKKPFVYGSAAFKISEPTSEHSHQWAVYVRGMENEDMSYFIEKVTFLLFNTFEKPMREITTPPYEVWETGWGEFVITITIYFKKESRCPPVELKHQLKLFPDGGQAAQSAQRKRPVMSEQYDEFLFVNPTKSFYEIASSTANQRFDNHRLITHFTNNKFSADEERQQKQIERARQQIKRKIDKLRRELFLAQN